MLISTFGVFELVDWLQQDGGAGAWSWAYVAMAATVGVGTLVALLSVEPEGPSHRAEGLANRFAAAVVHPFVDFIAQPGWLAALLFVMLFKFGDAFAGVMTAPFVLDIGFDKVDYGRVVKLFGFAAVLIGGFLGGYVQRLFDSTLSSLWLAGILQMISNLLFVWLAWVGADYGLLIATIAVENLTGGFATVIFVAYLSGLCGNRDYTATQYALLSALSAVGRTVLSSTSGEFAEALGWAPFFLLSTVAAVPGLMLLWYLTHREKQEVRT
jgi:PAT family beta-lactamase induction signal transducer AmpG